MMKNLTLNRNSQAQLALSVLVWMLLFATPLLVSDFTNGINWNLITKIWKEYSVLFLIFLVNRYVLIPRLFFKGKRRFYFLSIVSIILLFSATLFFMQYIFTGDRGKEHRPPINQRPYPQEQALRPTPEKDLSPPDEQAFRPPPDLRRPLNVIPPFANLLVISILLIGFDSGLMFFSKWMQSEQHKLKVEKENIRNKMAFLQNQVSPHFFMNTLNNIHALIDIDTTEAKEAVIRLSRMMDYMLYESQSEKIPVTEEMRFIRSYVELMKLRITDDVDLILDIPETLPHIKLPPLLTVAFIENAFKYGISYEKHSYIHIQIEASEKDFTLKVKNLINKEVEKRKSSGLGIENTRKRLELIYGKSYQLDITTIDNSFEVYLNVPV